MDDGRRKTYLPLIEASLYQKKESRSRNSRSRDRCGAKIEIESILFKSRLGVDGIGMESAIHRNRNASGNDYDRVWDRLLQSVIFTYRGDFLAIGNTAIGNADRGCLGVWKCHNKKVLRLVSCASRLLCLLPVIGGYMEMSQQKSASVGLVNSFDRSYLVKSNLLSFMFQ
ncbi:hypothetical protein LXL04_007223 [Taraxacum kok-saghyz]